MYITVNEQRYSDINRQILAGELVYTGGALTGIESVSGIIRTYVNNGFLLAEDNVSDYARQIIQEGKITLTNRPEPGPEPDPPEPEPDIWDELAEAIKDGVNDVE